MVLFYELGTLFTRLVRKVTLGLELILAPGSYKDIFGGRIYALILFGSKLICFYLGIIVSQRGLIPCRHYNIVLC